MIRGFVVIWICLVLGSVVSAQSKEDLQREKREAFDDLKLARELMEKTAAQRSSSVQQLRILQKGINSRSKVIETVESEVNLLSQNISDTQVRIDKLTIENKRNREEYAQLIYYAYRNHTEYEKLMYILAGSTISQSYQRYKYLKYIGKYRVRKAAEIEASIIELDQQKKSLNSLKNEKLSLMEDKESEQKKLVAQRSTRTSMINSLKRRESELNREIREKERIAKELEGRIREIIEEEARRLNSDNIYGALTPEQEMLGNDFRKNKGKLPWPVEKGIITIGYGNHEVPGLRGSSVKNNGVDITSSPSTEVRAVFEGDVTKVFGILGANYTVLVRHGEFLSVYQNLVNVRVKTGDKVLTKEKLGEAFTDENDHVATVHFEVWQERNILNPEEWISK